MAIFAATITVLMDVEDTAEACDCIAETLRPHLRRFSRDSQILDWNYAPSCIVPDLATAEEINASELTDKEIAACNHN